MRRFLKNLPRNGEKRSQNRENLHKAIYVIFHIKKFLVPTQVFLSETLYFELPKNLVICFKETFASLLVDTTKTSHSCLLLLNSKQRISPELLKLQISESHLNLPKTICNRPKPSTTIPKAFGIALSQPSPLRAIHSQPGSIYS